VSDPRVLAFDTSAAHCASALLIGDRVVAHRHEDMMRGQAEGLMPMLEAVIGDAGLAWEDLDAIGVGTGPGNFTGIRIAVAAARGLSMALCIPAIGVSRFDALVAGQQAPAAACVAAPRGRCWLRCDGAAPCLIDPMTWVPAAHLRGAVLVGDRAEPIAARIGARAAAPVDPLAVAIARLAGDRLSDPGPPPAPLYLRPPDAALPDTAPPIILP
jgi:tRNA threonylcarbamoyladenosine biosynthesis protein TsaB